MPPKKVSIQVYTNTRVFPIDLLDVTLVCKDGPKYSELLTQGQIGLEPFFRCSDVVICNDDDRENWMKTDLGFWS